MYVKQFHGLAAKYSFSPKIHDAAMVYFFVQAICCAVLIYSNERINSRDVKSFVY
jgi:hypothetical protein